MRKITILLLLLAGCDTRCNTPTLTYEPTKFDGNCYVQAQYLMKQLHFDKVELVLNHYEITYKRTGATTIQLGKKHLPEKSIITASKQKTANG
ncbi:hypothetical protein AB833_09880 [Chromatiales bacterium (ex Bugula neritina AB1)]|nr:hypothetical protein AB833_09880 [Chromatiales bacterium (ex Bugula neritina AB1)]